MTSHIKFALIVMLLIILAIPVIGHKTLEDQSPATDFGIDFPTFQQRCNFIVQTEWHDQTIDFQEVSYENTLREKYFYIYSIYDVDIKGVIENSTGNISKIEVYVFDYYDRKKAHFDAITVYSWVIRAINPNLQEENDAYKIIKNIVELKPHNYTEGKFKYTYENHDKSVYLYVEAKDRVQN